MKSPRRLQPGTGSATASEWGYTFKRYGLRWYQVRELLVTMHLPLCLADRALLLALWQCEGRDDGLVWAAVAKLGAMTSMSERRARAVLHSLCDRELVVFERERGGRRRPNIYSVRWDRLALLAKRNPDENDSLSTQVEQGEAREGRDERVLDPAGLYLVEPPAPAGRVHDTSGNPADFGPKGCPLAPETRNESTPDHGFDHQNEHEVITEGLSPSSPSQTLVEMARRIEAAAAPFPVALRKEAALIASRWLEDPGQTAHTRNELRKLAARARVPWPSGFPEVVDLEIAAGALAAAAAV
jgi:hypothetical protein